MDTQNQNYYQENNQNQGLVNKDLEGGADMQTMLRVGFIKKVYGILSFQLFITVVMCSFTFIPAVRQFCHTDAALIIFFICVALNIVLAIPIICCKSVARSVPTNYILLTLWTICEAYMVAICCSMYAPEVVIAAASLTAAVTIALTVYAWTTKDDFTFCGGMLFVCTVLMICLSFFWVFTGFLNSVYCILGALLYSIYLIYDTQLVMGKFGYEYNGEDYILAALMIYIDIIQIFLYLLQLFGRK